MSAAAPRREPPATADAIADRIRAVVDERPDLARLLEEQAARMPERVFGASRMAPRRFLEIYLEEALAFLDVLEPRLQGGPAVLEVGGGLGLLHALLAGRGADVTSVEPAGPGFSLFRQFAVPLLAALGADPARYVDAPGERLPFADASFDLVVSNNVLEHVADVEAVLRSMYRVCRPGGALVHACPNSLVPYEPHYRVPVIPGAVQASGRLFWRRFRDDPLWRSLNGIHALRIRRIAGRLPRARLSFRSGLALALERMGRGGLIASRHGALGRIALAPPVRRLLSALPATLASPMIFEIRRGEDPAGGPAPRSRRA